MGVAGRNNVGRPVVKKAKSIIWTFHLFSTYLFDEKILVHSRKLTRLKNLTLVPGNEVTIYLSRNVSMLVSSMTHPIRFLPNSFF